MSATYRRPRYISHTEQARMIRAALKSAFPGVKFSVRRSRGFAIDIEWTDGPTGNQVDAVAQLYRGGGFDGMEDLRYNVQTMLTTDDGAEVVQFAMDFVFTRRNISDGWRDRIFAMFSLLIGRDLDPSEWSSWNERVPLSVSHDGTLHRMADAYTTDIREVFHQFTGARQGGSLDMSAPDAREP